MKRGAVPVPSRFRRFHSVLVWDPARLRRTKEDGGGAPGPRGGRVGGGSNALIFTYLKENMTHKHTIAVKIDSEVIQDSAASKRPF